MTHTKPFFQTKILARSVRSNELVACSDTNLMDRRLRTFIPVTEEMFKPQLY